VNNVNRRFVAMPYFLNLDKQNLKTLDTLIYITIRSFHNSSTGLCYPSYEKIMEKSGLSRGFVADSIKRLEAAGHFKITHSNRQGTCNQYYFNKLHPFKPIPYDLFEAIDLTCYEKAMLLCLRPFFIIDILVYLGSIKSIAKALGLSYKQVYSPYKSLIAKGYLKECSKISKSSAKGSNYLYLTDKIYWEYDFKKEINVFDNKNSISPVKIKVV
jgi:hypothetical protein